MDRMIQILKELNIGDAEKKARVLQQYMEMVLERNRAVNLTAITDPGEFVEKHYADSLAAAMLPEFSRMETVLDLGTGGGFPGIPLAVAFPEKKFTLLDSLNKRIRIIQEFCEELEIVNVTAIHGRAEDLGRDPMLREQFDGCVSRAVADLRVLAEYCIPFVKPGGCFISYKGANCGEEVAAAEHAVKLLGGEIRRIRPVSVGDADEEAAGRPQREAGNGSAENGHQLIVIEKIGKTPGTYPRRAGIPGKKPL